MLALSWTTAKAPFTLRTMNERRKRYATDDGEHVGLHVPEHGDESCLSYHSCLFLSASSPDFYQWERQNLVRKE